MQRLSTDEWEAVVGGQLRAARLAVDIDQATAAERGNIGLTALKNLEAGKGSTLRTLIGALRSLGLEDWLDTLYETSSVSPLALADAATSTAPRRRASHRRGTT